MDFIEEVLCVSSRSNKRDLFSSVLALIFFFSFNIFSIIFFSSSEYFIFIFFLGIVISPIIGFILGFKLFRIFFRENKTVKFKNSKLYKKLKKSGDLLLFVNDINKEINLPNTIKYSSNFMGVGLLVTNSWFVYIDALYPFTVKTDDILKISEEISMRDSTSFLCLELKNKKYLRLEKLCYDDIETEIKEKYPNIEIGVGIIEEE